MSLTALTLLAVMKGDTNEISIVPAVAVSVTFLSLKSDLPTEYKSKLLEGTNGWWANLGAKTQTAVADQLCEQKVAEDVASPKLLVGLDGKTACILSFLDDGQKQGYGCEVTARPNRTGFDLDVKVGDPGDNKLVNPSQFKLSSTGDSTFMLCPKASICGMPMVVLVKASKTP